MALQKKKYFITGTDSNVGTTFVSCALLAKARQQQLVTGALKPVAAGCEQMDGVWRSRDAQQLQAYASLTLPYDAVNPVALRAAVAPSIAAECQGKTLQVARLQGFVRGAMMTPADLWLVEGAGGWLAPLNARETLADLAASLATPVVLVVAMRPGCINHALLTAAAIAQRGLPLAAWVANCKEDKEGEMEAFEQYLATMAKLLPGPCLGRLPQCASPEEAAQHLDINPLVG